MNALGVVFLSPSVRYATDKSFWPENSFSLTKIADDEEEETNNDEVVNKKVDVCTTFDDLVDDTCSPVCYLDT